MDLDALLVRVREHYVDQFRAFASRQRASCTQGAAEVKFQLSDQCGLFDRLYCADFVRNDDGPEVIEFQPENILTFDALHGTFGKASLLIEHLRWDDMVIRHGLQQLPAESLARWFRVWFDPDDERYDASAELGGLIHSLMLQADSMSIDFGTADPEAFWDILQLPEAAGSTHLEVSSSRAATLD